MALNNAHAGKGVLIFSGECIILYCDHVGIEFSGGGQPAILKGTKNGRLYLTTHRVIFINKDSKDQLQSFSSPFYALKNVELEQPVFGANYISGKVAAQSNGGLTGEVKFKLTFKHGGAIEFGQALLKVASMAGRNTGASFRENPPPYTPPAAQWYAPPPEVYAPPTAGYYGWAPPTHVFPDRPQSNEVFMYESPPPYPGVNSPPNYPQGAFANGTAPTAPPGNCKAEAASAANTAYYDPKDPSLAFVPPPAYGFQVDSPPTYDDAVKKSN